MKPVSTFGLVIIFSAIHLVIESLGLFRKVIITPRIYKLPIPSRSPLLQETQKVGFRMTWFINKEHKLVRTNYFVLYIKSFPVCRRRVGHAMLYNYARRNSFKGGTFGIGKEVPSGCGDIRSVYLEQPQMVTSVNILKRVFIYHISI